MVRAFTDSAAREASIVVSATPRRAAIIAEADSRGALRGDISASCVLLLTIKIWMRGDEG